MRIGRDAEGYATTMSSPDQPPPVSRDLAEDEPDLPADDELEALKPPLPPLDTNPLDPVPPVAPGPEDTRAPMAGVPQEPSSVDEMAEKIRDRRLS